MVTEQLVNHVPAHARFVEVLRGGQAVHCSTHTLAECFATLTALPLPQRISGIEAVRLIDANFTHRLRVIELDKGDFQKAMQLCADRGRISGQIYDALHLIAARKANCQRLFTYNLRHFQTLSTEGIQVVIP